MKELLNVATVCEIAKPCTLMPFPVWDIVFNLSLKWNEGTVAPSYLWVLYPWIQPMADQKYLSKETIKKYGNKNNEIKYDKTSIYKIFTLY